MTVEQRLMEAVCKDDVQAVRSMFASHPALKARINDPLAPFNSPLINSVRSREMLDALLDAGADINARSRWWAGGYGILDTAIEEVALHAIKRGAKLTVHAAARLGLLDELPALIDEDPALVTQAGPDGQTPLHLAKTIPIAEFLLERGADIDAQDIDHESTPVQYMLGNRPDVARFLVQRGCETDIFVAAALGDLELARKHIADNPECLRRRVNDESFPRRNPHAGGTIYQWTLGFHVSPHEVAKTRGHDEVYRFLMDQSPEDVRLINACWAGDEAALSAALAKLKVTAVDRQHLEQQLAHAARNNNLSAVRLMLAAGLPVTCYGQHHATPLHWAAWHGNAAMVRLLLEHNAELENNDNEFNGTPLDWAVHGSENGWHRETGDYVTTVRTLLDAGARIPNRTDGTEEVRQLLRARS